MAVYDKYLNESKNSESINLDEITDYILIENEDKF